MRQQTNRPEQQHPGFCPVSLGDWLEVCQPAGWAGLRDAGD